MSLIEDKTFEKQDYTKNRLPKGDYEYCKFLNCNFSEGFLSEIKFLECEFIACNLSSTNITSTSFQDVSFQDCKLLGLHFDTVNPFGFAVDFKNCQLNHASFYQLELKKTRFINSKLIQVDFNGSNLKASTFDGCDLSQANFENSNLEKVDFRKAINYTIHPDQNKMKGAKFSLEGVVGLLASYGVEVEA